MRGYASSVGASTTTTSGRIDRSARNRPRCSQRASRVMSKRAVSLRSIGSDPKNGFLKSLWRRDRERARPSATPPNSPHDHSAMVTSCAIYDRHQHRDMFVLPHRRWLEFGGTVSFDDDALDPVAAQRTNQGGDRLLFVGDGQRSVAFEQIEIELALADIGTDVDRGKLLCHEYSNLLNSGSGPIRLFELTQESMNRCTLVNGLRLQLGAVVASSWFIDELRIAHGPQLIPMSARSGTYKQLQRTVMDKMPRHIGQRAAAEPRRHRAARHAVPLRSVCIYTP